MPQPIRILADVLPERFRTDWGRRATGITVAVLLELLLILLLLTLGRSDKPQGVEGPVLTTFDAASTPEEEAEPEPEPEPEPEKPKPEPEPAESATPQPREAEPEPTPPEKPEPAPPQPAPKRPVPIPVPQEQMSRFDIGNLPSRPAPPAPAPAPKQAMGPADSRAGSDSQRVGTAPNGQPLYAAQWFRKPYPSELTGYLSTARGPGWGLIACKTAPEYRVEDCVALDEFPANSHIARAALAAAWQFKVRPPRLGGRYMVGEWVRIRIDYGLKQE